PKELVLRTTLIGRNEVMAPLEGVQQIGSRGHAQSRTVGRKDGRGVLAFAREIVHGKNVGVKLPFLLLKVNGFDAVGPAGELGVGTGYQGSLQVGSAAFGIGGLDSGLGSLDKDKNVALLLFL